MTEPIQHVFVDLDGVLADFVGAALELHGRPDVLDNWPPGEWNISAVLGVSSGEFWKALDRQGAGFWESLEPFPWTFELLDTIGKVAPFTILTCPSLDPGCLDGKVRWLHRHLGRSFRDFLIGPSKHLLARPEFVLIDDSDRNIARFREHHGHGILFPQIWNANHSQNDRLAYVRDALARAGS